MIYRVILASLLLIPTCTGCCAFLVETALDSLVGSDHSFEEQREIDEQNAKFQAYEDDKKVLDEHPSNVWNYSTSPQ